MNWIPYGPDAWLLRFAERLGPETFARGRAIAADLERNPPSGLREFVPGFASVLLEFHPGAAPDPAALTRWTGSVSAAPLDLPALAPIKEIPVIYDGPDLGRVAEHARMSPAEVAALHCATVYHIYLIGFAPGFPYLGDLDPRLHTPRLASPRPRVAAGSVAIGGEHTGIYPVDSPGGWNLIGRTSVKIFDPQRRGGGDDRAMFWLQAGDRVRFVPVTERG